MFIPNLYVFRALMCSSSGESIVLCLPSGMHTRRSRT